MKKNIAITCLLVFFVQTINSQNKKIVDSLQLLLANHPSEDSVKIAILTKLHEKLMFAEPLAAKKYAEEELRISRKIDYKEGIGRGFTHLADFYTNRSNTDSALYYYNKAKKVFTSINKDRGLIFVNYSIADIERTSGNFDTAIKMLNENLTLIEKSESNPKAVIKFSSSMHESLGNVFMEKGDYKIAVIETLKALEMYTEMKDELRRADALRQMGDLECKLTNYQKAIEYYNEAINTYIQLNDDFYLAQVKNSSGQAFKELRQLNKAKANQQEAIELARKNQSRLVLSNSLNDLSQLYMLEKKHKIAKDLLIEAREIAKQENLKLPLANAHKSLAILCLQTNEPLKSLSDINEAITIEESVGAMSNLQNSYVLRSKIYEQLGKAPQALMDLQAAQKINDSLFNIKQSQQIEELKTIYETEKKEAEIALQDEEIKTLNQKSRADNLQKGLYAGGMVATLALLGLAVFGYRQRIKKNRIEREKQEEIYRQKIEHKQKELASQTLHLVQKNTFIQELKENLENLKNSPEKFKTEFRRIVMLLKKENASDKDWEVFKTYFADVHNDFDQKLKTLYADISEKEIRLAAFLRMNLTTKEIAATLNVLPDSILKSKYRLKKKLNLEKETDLTSFLNTL